MLLGFSLSRYRARPDPRVLTHSFPTRRSSDLECAASRSRLQYALRPPRKTDFVPATVRRTGAQSADDAATRAGQRRSAAALPLQLRSEEHTSELQSLMRISYAVFCLKKKTHILTRHTYPISCKCTYTVLQVTTPTAL